MEARNGKLWGWTAIVEARLKLPRSSLNRRTGQSKEDEALAGLSSFANQFAATRMARSFRSFGDSPALRRTWVYWGCSFDLAAVCGNKGQRDWTNAFSSTAKKSGSNVLM